jgi:ABC-type phosphate/phosphonate transport system substrate-binding protein
MSRRHPDPTLSRFAIRLVTRALAVGAALTNGQNHYKTFPVSGSARVRVRFQATKGGTLKLRFVAPDFDVNLADATHALANGTEYSTGAPDDVAVSADTEAMIEADCYGEAYVRVNYVPSTTGGVVTYCDISQV